MLPSSHKEIGGYFGFDLNDTNQFPYPLAKKYCSARAAFYDLVRNLGIQAIWMPKFICDTMLKPLELLNISIKFYDINEDFFPLFPPLLEKNEYFLYVNYFGLCFENQKKLMELYPLDRLIFDHSQAFFIEPFQGVNTLYSPRKFLPVADGGLLASALNMPEVAQINDSADLIQQYQHVFTRLIDSAQSGYAYFLDAESKLNDCIPKKISPISELILNSLDYQKLKQERLRNFEYLHSKLGRFNQININLDAIESPLTYPFLWREKLSNSLISKKIFTPTYWNDCLARVNESSFEYLLVHKVTHLVCDHRYNMQDMQYQIDQIMEYL